MAINHHSFSIHGHHGFSIRGHDDFWVQVFSHHTVFLSLDSYQSSDSRPSSRYLRIARVPHFTDMIVRRFLLGDLPQ
jgi:hypothetical protein